ncbi:MAG: PASTA domain-containing protein [Firmicutes bacterium]|nr:PASTA domain-containing protein [Bacillota bacterium]
MAKIAKKINNIEDIEIEEKKQEQPDKKQTKKTKHPFVNIMLFITILSGIIYFITTLEYKSDDLNVLENLINILLLFLFTIFFVSASITNNSKHKATTFISALLLTIYNTLGVLTTLSIVTIPNLSKVEDFREKNLTEVVNWATKNNITLKEEYEYSDMIDEYKVISQNIKPGKDIKNIKSLTISISEGPDPNKEVVVPDMVTWDSDRVLEFINNNHLSNVKVEFTESDKIKDTVIDQNKKGNLKRNDEIKLKFSLGEDELGETKLIDLTNKSEFETTFYLKQHKIKYKQEKDFSSKIKRGYTSKQSIKPGTMIKPNDKEVVITISKGRKIKVPNLKEMSVTKITSWIVSNRLKLEITDKYDDKVKDNKVISANYKKDDVIEQGTKVSIVISKGKLKMPKFKTLADFYEWADKYEINYEEKREFSDTVKQGEVIKYSVKVGNAIKNNETIIVTISDGKQCEVPDLKDLTKSEAIKKLKSVNLNYNFLYKNSNSIKKDKVISQSISAGSKVSNGTTVTVTLSNGKKVEETVQKRENKNTSTNTNTNNNTTPTPKPTTPTCTPQTYTVSGAIKNIFNNYSGYSEVANQLNSFFKSNYPNVKISIVGVSDTGMNPGSYIGGTAGPGKSVTSCNSTPYTIQIAK